MTSYQRRSTDIDTDPVLNRYRIKVSRLHERQYDRQWLLSAQNPEHSVWPPRAFRDVVSTSGRRLQTSPRRWHDVSRFLGLFPCHHPREWTSALRSNHETAALKTDPSPMSEQRRPRSQIKDARNLPRRRLMEMGGPRFLSADGQGPPDRCMTGMELQIWRAGSSHSGAGPKFASAKWRNICRPDSRTTCFSQYKERIWVSKIKHHNILSLNYQFKAVIINSGLT